MKVLELFAGSRCIGKAAEHLGNEVFSVDWIPYDGINLTKDIQYVDENDLPFGWIPDHIHASFDCTTYTIAAISHHRNGIEPKSEYAKKCDAVNQAVIDLLYFYKSFNPNITYSFENPRGMLRKMPFMQQFIRYTVWYCQYGDNRAKPTDIWTDLDWTPKPICHNGNNKCHHESAPRGSKTGTQGKKGSYERSKIPNELCLDLMMCLGTKKNIPQLTMF